MNGLQTLLIVSLLLVVVSAHAPAQDEPGTVPEAPADVDAGEAGPNSEPAASNTGSGSTDSGDFRVFVPSEEIPEDQSVPFPVDI